MTKWFTKPITVAMDFYPVSNNLIKAEQNLTARKTLTLIMLSKSCRTQSRLCGDMIQVHIRRENEKHGF